MKGKEMVKLLFPGVILGIVLGMGIGMAVGVNPTDPKPNYIGGAVCCIIPTLLNCTVVLKQTASKLKRKLSFGGVLKRIIPYVIMAALIGFLSYVIVIEKVIGFDSCAIPRLTNAIIQACLGIVTSTFFGYIAIKKYIKDVKYTKRK